MVTKLKEKVKFQKLLQLATTLASFQYIMNPGMLGTQQYSSSVAYLEPWNIQKFDGI